MAMTVRQEGRHHTTLLALTGPVAVGPALIERRGTPSLGRPDLRESRQSTSRCCNA